MSVSICSKLLWTSAAWASSTSICTYRIKGFIDSVEMQHRAAPRKHPWDNFAWALDLESLLLLGEGLLQILYALVNLELQLAQVFLSSESHKRRRSSGLYTADTFLIRIQPNTHLSKLLNNNSTAAAGSVGPRFSLEGLPFEAEPGLGLVEPERLSSCRT